MSTIRAWTYAGSFWSTYSSIPEHLRIYAVPLFAQGAIIDARNEERSRMDAVIIGDTFTHIRSGTMFVCRAIKTSHYRSAERIAMVEIEYAQPPMKD